MRIVIDLQGAQGGSRFRGIGRYSLALSKAIARNRGKHEVIIALNGSFRDSVESIRAEFEGVLPQQNIRVWASLDGGSTNDSIEGAWCYEAAELIREAFLASLQPDIVLISSLFESLKNQSVNIGNFTSQLPTAVILYDLIPLIYRDIYCLDFASASWYESKLDHLRRADCLLAISESSRQEGINYLNFPQDKIVNISGAVDEFLCLAEMSSEEITHLYKRYNLTRPYIMYTGGIDHRKNIEGLISAYAKLPVKLRNEHMLVIVCAIELKEKMRLNSLAKDFGLTTNEVIFTGFVPEEDLIKLYSLCKAFVFPSWHEGFGLPVLEAMTLGRAVIAADAASLPEILDCEEALFDPHDQSSITTKLEQVLTDTAFRQRLEQHGLARSKSFTWDISAKRAIEALENVYKNRAQIPQQRPISKRPKLAYLSPLPPERSGISDYSIELLPELSRHYIIDIISDNADIDCVWIKANCGIYSVDWFKENAKKYDRILYHFGNSEFHKHMFELLAEFPGVIVLHDFFLSGVVGYMDLHGGQQGFWGRSLYRSHGYSAFYERYHAKKLHDVMLKYPCNFDVLQEAHGIITHSEHSQDLACQWNDCHAKRAMRMLPLLRAPALTLNRESARFALGLSSNDFVVCSFGILGPTKLNQELLDAWFSSRLAEDVRCRLIFVGENHHGEYGLQITKAINKSKCADRIHITEWVAKDDFQYYLCAADLAVQLRTLSRGETSAAVLDCMNYALPTIINAHGSMAALPDNAAWKLPDSFVISELVYALEQFWHNKDLRVRFGEAAKKYITEKHNPRTCADQCREAIEDFYKLAATNKDALVDEITSLNLSHASQAELLHLASTVAKSIPENASFVRKQILVDVSTLVMCDNKTDIQRFMCSILNEWLLSPPKGFRVEPVYTVREQPYRYARRFSSGFLNCPVDLLRDDFVEYSAGDIFLGLDFQPHAVIKNSLFYHDLRHYGVNVQFVVYDIFNIKMSEHAMNCTQETLQNWLAVIAECSGAICISNVVADEFSKWLKNHSVKRKCSFQISCVELGVAVNNLASASGVQSAQQLLECILPKKILSEESSH